METSPTKLLWGQGSEYPVIFGAGAFDLFQAYSHWPV